MKKSITPLLPYDKNDQNASNFYYSPDYHEPLLEYVEILANHIDPITPVNYNNGNFVPSPIGTFATRYFQNELNQLDKSEYLKNEQLIETVELMGYDIEKFWYLVFFIFDFSYGYCKEGVKIAPPRRKINEFLDTIIENIESFNGQNEAPNFKREMLLTLSVKGKSKLEINDQDAIFFISLMCSKELNRTKQSLGLDSVKLTEIQKQKENLEESPQPIQIFYFTKIFQTFFELNPPKRKRAPKDSGLDFSRIFLISRLCYLIGLSFDRRFMEDSTALNALLTYYKRQQIEKANGIYATENSILNFL